MPVGIQYFREDKGGDLKTLLASQTARNAKPELVESVIAADSEWRKMEFEVNTINKQLNQLSKEIGAKKKAKEDAAELIAQVEKTKAELKTKQDRLNALEKEVKTKIRMIGNLVHDTVPMSKSEDDNVIVKTVGECKRDHAKYHHHELLHMIDGYSAERGVTVAGHRGYFLKGVGVLLNQALVQYGLSFLMKRQYTPLQPPFFMRKEIMADTAQLEEFDEALYHVSGGGEDNDFYLIATSEQPISAYHRDEWLEKTQLPIRYGGFSTCFRKEAGSYGRDAWGIFRIHQFEKIEQFCITAPEDSWAMHEEMIKTCEEFYASLGLSYQIVNIVSGALNNAAAKKYDLEAWFPTLGVYRELVSASNCTDYQSRAMETRFGQKKAGQTEKQYVHMLNATLCATERTICCLLENYQTPEGVTVPEVLRPFMGGIEFMPFTQKPPKASATAEATRNQAAPAAANASASSSSASATPAKPADVKTDA